MRARFMSIRGALWMTISVMTLLIAVLVMQEVYVQWRQLQKIESLKDATVVSDQLFDAIDKLSVERDVAFAMLHAPDNQDIVDLQSRLKDSRRDADAALSQSLFLLQKYDFPELVELRGKIETRMTGIRGMRADIDKAVALPKAQRDPALADRWYDEVTGLTTQAQGLWVRFIRHFTDINPIVTQHLRYKHFLLLLTDYSGRERSMIGKLLVENADPTPAEMAQLLNWQGMLDLGWSMTRLLAEQSGLYDDIGPYFNDAQSHYLTMYGMVRDLFFVPGAQHNGAYPIGVDLWFELSTQFSDSLDALKTASKNAKHQYVEGLEREAKHAIAVHLGVLIFALGLCFYCIRVISLRVIRPINAMVEALVDATQDKPVSFVPLAVGRKDEIGKLADVLHAFQQKTEEIKYTSGLLTNYTHALERSNKELDDFAYIASHDLKEPLRGIHNHARFLLEDNEGKLEADSVQRLGRLVYLTQRMEKLVNDLLYFSRLGRQELAIEHADINDVIHDIENTLDIFLAERHAHIVIPRPLPVIICDKTRITEVFRNLITNAVKYNDKPEKMVEIGFLDSHPAPDGTLRQRVFYVKDDGKGIASEFFDEVFRIFKRLETSKDSQEEGTGVGLTFVKKIIERHNGTIWLESQPGEGTTFYFVLGDQCYARA